MATYPAEGTPAPDFSLPGQDGNTHSLHEWQGKYVVLYFYPKDMTPGCTREACGFRDALAALQPLNAVVVGISRDSIASHEKFAAKYELPFLLLSDPDHQVAEAYGVWQEKKNYGKTSMGVVRTTFILDPQGRIAKIFPKVKVDGHVEKVIEALQQLQATSTPSSSG
ncbi:MAG: thioredoxin-dependent thiol peroxidase [Firmicutes bacterium]|nr:thioredoxin-dependent thiol peroxidase [Bacillota bacterium]